MHCSAHELHKHRLASLEGILVLAITVNSNLSFTRDFLPRVVDFSAFLTQFDLFCTALPWKSNGYIIPSYNFCEHFSLQIQRFNQTWVLWMKSKSNPGRYALSFWQKWWDFTHKGTTSSTVALDREERFDLVWYWTLVFYSFTYDPCQDQCSNLVINLKSHSNINSKQKSIYAIVSLAPSDIGTC